MTQAFRFRYRRSSESPDACMHACGSCGHRMRMRTAEIVAQMTRVNPFVALFTKPPVDACDTWDTVCITTYIENDSCSSHNFVMGSLRPSLPSTHVILSQSAIVDMISHISIHHGNNRATARVNDTLIAPPARLSIHTCDTYSGGGKQSSSPTQHVGLRSRQAC